MHSAPSRLWPALLPALFGLGCASTPATSPTSTTDACALFALIEPADGAEPSADSETKRGSGGDADDKQEKKTQKSYAPATLALLASRAANEARRAEARVRDAGKPTGRGANELEGVLAAMDDGALELERFLEIQRTDGHALAELDERFSATWTTLVDYCKGRKGVRECTDIPVIAASGAREKLLALAANASSFKNPVLKKQLGEIKEIDAAGDKLVARYRAVLSKFDERLGAARKREDSARTAVRSTCGGAVRPRTGPTEVIAAPTGSNPRDVVVVVETHPGPALTKAFERMAAESDGGHGNRPTAASGYGSGFGSGFLVVRGAGDQKHTYVITNRHVAEMGDIAIRTEQGKRLPQADVIYEDPFADLAVIGFSKEPGGAGGLSIADRPAKDGDPVVVLGFPGLGNTPAYQMTRGNVSNERLRVDGLRLLQHTAPTDPGSSGGPLLNAEGRVVGVASGKARDREAVSVAVPRADLIDALDRAADTERRRDEEGFRKASLYDSCLLAVSSAEEDWEPPRMLFSKALVDEQGLIAFAKLVESFPEKREQLAAMWREEPIHALDVALGNRLVHALRVEASIHGDEACRNARAATNLVATRYPEVTLHGTERAIELRFVFERGRYKLRDF